MSKDDNAPLEINEAVTRTVLNIEILHPTDIDPAGMTHAEMAGYTDMGQLVTRTTVKESREIDDDAIDAELEAIGAQPGHFALPQKNERRTVETDSQG